MYIRTIQFWKSSASLAEVIRTRKGSN